MALSRFILSRERSRSLRVLIEKFETSIRCEFEPTTGPGNLRLSSPSPWLTITTTLHSSTGTSTSSQSPMSRTMSRWLAKSMHLIEMLRVRIQPFPIPWLTFTTSSMWMKRLEWSSPKRICPFTELQLTTPTGKVNDIIYMQRITEAFLILCWIRAINDQDGQN